jgi:hypothetical protein
MSFWNTSNPKKVVGEKDPNSILDYPIDWSEWLTAISDTHASHTIENITGGIVKDASNHSAGIITVWLSGGTVGETASFTVRIVTAGGRTEDRTFYLKIREF